MKAYFVYNPQAGQMQIKNSLWGIVNVFSQANYELTIRATQQPKDAYQTMLQHGKEYSLVICSGGDGTLNEVINGIMELEKDQRPVVGYIPAGSTNDYAASIELPKNMVEAAQLITTGQPKALDMGKFNNQYFVYVAAFGAFTEVSYGTPQDIKNILGHLAYVLKGIQSVATIKSYHVKVLFDNQEKEEDYIYGMVSNSLSVGGLYKMKHQDVKLDDGLFEVMLIRTPKNLAQLNSITSYLLGIETTSPCIETFKVKHITFVNHEEMPWALDGEYGGDPDITEISVMSQAVQIIKA